MSISLIRYAEALRVVRGDADPVSGRNTDSAGDTRETTGYPGLLDALELTMLIARKDPNATRGSPPGWLQRLLEEHSDVTIEEAALAASCLVALPGADHREGAQTLKVMAERATSRWRTRENPR